MRLPVLSPEDTFKCCQCGKCCEHIRGMLPAQDSEFIQKMAYGKLPLVQLIPIEKMSFPLWDWEAKRFLKWNEERSIGAVIRPSRGILDLASNRAIIVTYFIDADACPFLEKGSCRIYDKKRAYICRLFPFNQTPFLRTGEEVTKHNMFGTCTAMEKVLPKIPESRDEMIPYLAKAFPDGSFENAVQFDFVSEWVNRTIVDLMKQKKMRPAMNYPYDFFLKRFQNAEKIHFSDFLEEVGYIESKEALIDRFDDNEDAKKIIANALNGN